MASASTLYDKALKVAFAIAVLLRPAAGLAQGGHAEDAAAMRNTATLSTQAGSASVEPRSGSATWSYRLSLPPGRDGLTPDLALRYSSDGGNSWAGRGFHLDTPAIHRDTRDGAPPYDAESGFRDDAPPDDSSRAANFVFDSGGATPLLRMRDVEGGVEYRLARDPDDVQFILRVGGSEPNTWVVRTRDGREQVYRPAVIDQTRFSQPASIERTFSWQLSRVRDRNGNVIDYAYSEGYGPSTGPAYQAHHLAHIWYGANDGSTGAPAVPHLFRVSFAREGAPVPEALRTPDGTAYPSYAGDRAVVKDFRAGGELHTGGNNALLRAASVEVAWPGSTDELRYEFPTRRVRYWTFRYNWDRVGAKNTDQWWPLLEQIEQTDVDIDGVEAHQRPVRLEYYGFDRTIVPRETFSGPVSTPIRPSEGLGGPLTDAFYPSFGTTVTNDAGSLRRAGLYPGEPVCSGANCSRFPHALPGRVQLFLDADQDGLPDFVDLAATRRCFATSPDHVATWQRFLGDGSTGPSLGFDDERAWGAQEELLFASPSVIATPPSTFAGAVNCAAEPRRWYLLGNDRLRQPTVSGADVAYVDLDGDGFTDLLRNEGNQSVARWRLHRFRRSGTGQPGYESLTEGAMVESGPWQTSHGSGSLVTTGYYRGRDSDVPPSLIYSPSIPVNNGSLAMSAEFGFSDSRLTWASSEAGYLHDFTGDGLPDRLAVARSDVHGNGALVVYPSRGCRSLGAASAAPSVCAWDRSPRVWMKGLLKAPNRLVVASPAATVIPDHDPSDGTRAVQQIVTDLALDLNGDGLSDLVGVQPELRNQGGQARARLLSNPTVDWNYGAGFQWTGWENVVERAVGEIGALAVTDQTAADPVTGIRTAQTRHHWVDFNGDGLVDVVSADGWWLPNSGGVFAHGMRLDPPAAGVTWSEQGVTIDRSSGDGVERVHDHYGAQRQLIIDVNGDGRPDLVRLRPASDAPSGVQNVVEVYSDADMGAAPGRLRHVDDGRGYHVEYTYQTLAAALDGDATRPPVSGWVVREMRERAGDAATAEGFVTTYRFAGAQFGPDPAVRVDFDRTPAAAPYAPIAIRPSVRGFATVESCRTSELDRARGLRTESTYRFAGALFDGLLVRRQTFGGCAPSAPLLSRDEWDYAGTSIEVSGSPVAGGGRERIVRNRLRGETHLVREPAREDHPTFNQPLGRADRELTTRREYEYFGDTPFVSRMADRGERPTDPDLRVVETEYSHHHDAPDAGYAIVPVRVTVQDGGGAVLSLVDYRYDGAPASAPTHTAGNLTAVITHAARDGAGFVTAFTRDALQRVTGVTSPSGRATRTCWDRYGMYPVRSADPTGLTTEASYSYVTGQLLEQRGPTGVARLAGECASYETAAVFQSRAPVPPITPTQTEKVNSPTVGPLAPIFMPGPGTTLVTGDERGEGAPSPPGDLFVDTTFERAPGMPLEPGGASSEPATRPPVPFGLLTWPEPVLPSGTLPPRPSVYPAPPTAAAWQLREDGAGRPIATFATERRADGGLEWVQLSAAEYAVGSVSLTRTREFLDGSHTALSETLVDGFGRTLESRALDGQGATLVPTRFDFDWTGDVAALTGPNPDLAEGGTVQARVVKRDARGRPVVVEGVDGRLSYAIYTTREELDPLGPKGQLVATYDHDRKLTGIVAYDLLGRVEESRRLVDPTLSPPAAAHAWLITRLRHDAAGQLVEIEEPDGATTVFRYDLRGLRTSADRYDAGTPATRSRIEGHEYTFDPDGALQETRDHLGRVTALARDRFGRVERVLVPEAESLPGYGDTTYGYQDDASRDGAGYLQAVTTPTETTRFAYDARGRVIGERRDVGASFGGVAFDEAYTFGYGYTRASQVAAVHAAHGSTGATHSFYFDYDWAGNVTRVRDGPIGSARTLLEWDYSPVNLPSSQRDLLGGEQLTWFDRAGRLRELRVTEGGAAQYTQVVGYSADGHGMPVSVNSDWHDGFALNLTNAFDQVDRLIRAHDDVRGYEAQIGFVRGPPNAGRPESLIERGVGDAPRDRQYVYEGHGDRGRDPAAVHGLKDAASGARVLSQEYGPHGTVVRRRGLATPEERYGVDPQGVVRTFGENAYLYDREGLRGHVYRAGEPDEVVATVGGLVEAFYERTASGFAAREVRFLAGGDVPAVRVRAGDARASILHRDLQGSVVLVRRQGESGIERTRFAYTPFGEALHATGPGLERELQRFQGGTIDPAGSSALQFGFRRYDATTHRWTGTDPAFHTDPYGFNRDNPLVFADPLGLQAVPPGSPPVERSCGGPGAADCTLTIIPTPASGPAGVRGAPDTPRGPPPTDYPPEYLDRIADTAVAAAEATTTVATRLARFGRWCPACAVAGGTWLGVTAVTQAVTGVDFANRPLPWATRLHGAVVGALRIGGALDVATSPSTLPATAMGATTRSTIGESPYAVAQAEDLSEQAQLDVNNLIEQIRAGNMNPGLGTRALGNRFFELRGRQGGRVIIYQTGAETYDIIGKFQGHVRGDDANSRIIQRLMNEYKSRRPSLFNR